MQVPLTMSRVAELLLEAGVPNGVFQVRGAVMLIKVLSTL